ncbi:MAG TPA: carbamoyl-phosphate synthase subunit L, partial [Bacteroidota bacterium]|nr:carbamoyl-phosphate synthase subunit L [Bacteroidota bacterium]
IDRLSDEQKQRWRERVRQQLSRPRPENIFYLRYGFQLGMTIDELHGLTKIDPWFLYNIKQIVDCEEELKQYAVDA